MMAQDENNSSPHVYVIDEPSAREPTIEELLSPLLRLSEARFQELAKARRFGTHVKTIPFS